MNKVMKPVAGVRLAAVEAGIKKAGRKDLVVIELAGGSHCAGVFTTNRFCAAPVDVSRDHLAETNPQYLMINTGYANAGTGAEGERLCLASCELLATLASCKPEQVLPFSTGVIGEKFPLPAFEKGLPHALSALSIDGWSDAASGIMTTDTYAKMASRQVEVGEQSFTISGIAKGSGMIKPNMATMLGFIATDAAIAPDLLQRWVTSLAEVSFNCVTVDGDTSTNDSCMLIATGKAGNNCFASGEEAGAAELYAALEQVFIELAQMLARDGEGATKFVTIEVEAAASQSDARTVAETIAHSPLVKTALFASDPNWGRILAAVGRAPIDVLDVNQVSIWLNDVQIVSAGAVAPEYREAAGAAAMANKDITIRVGLGAGGFTQTLWTCDFSYDYVKINAEYRT